MNKPNNYDTTSAGDFTPVELGGHFMVIKKVDEGKSKSGKPMLTVYFDFTAPDKQEGYFMQSFKDDIRPEKKWPQNGIGYVMTEDKDGNCNRDLKRFITSVEKSNNGFEVKWGLDFADQFKNKRVGGVFGIVEEEYNGKASKRHKLRWFCSWDSVETARIPNPKLLNNASGASGSTSEGGYITDIPAWVNEEVPWS